MIDFVGLGIVLLLIVLFGYLAFRSWGSKNRILKWVGVILSGLLTVVLALVFVGALVGTSRLNANYNTSNPAPDLQVAATAEQIAWGEKYAKFCADCHSSNRTLPLAGANFGGDIPIPMGTLYAPNLTPAGEIKDWTDGEIIRAIREGIHKNGRPLVIMPSDTFHHLSDEDVQGLVAYLRSQPAVEPNTPTNNLNVLGALLTNVRILENQPHITQPVPKPAIAPDAAYGEYLKTIFSCSGCHGENLAGGTTFDGEPAPNLTLVVPQWSEQEFITAFRTGVLPGGTKLNADKMPYPEFSEFMTDTDLQALYQYIHGLPPTQASNK